MDFLHIEGNLIGFCRKKSALAVAKNGILYSSIWRFTSYNERMRILRGSAIASVWCCGVCAAASGQIRSQYRNAYAAFCGGGMVIDIPGWLW